MLVGVGGVGKTPVLPNLLVKPLRHATAKDGVHDAKRVALVIHGMEALVTKQHVRLLHVFLY